MRKLFSGALTCCLFVLLGCSGDEGPVEYVYEYSINEPVFMPAAEFRSSVKVTEEPIPLTRKGKICFYEDYLYISSPEKGIHIVDNRNPASPRLAGYIELVGNRELAIRDHKLYADSYVDLVWFDLSNPEKPELEGRMEEAFRYSLPTVDNSYGYDYEMCFSEEAKTKGVVVGWELKDREEVRYKNPDGMYEDDMVASPGGSQGVNGSMSCFSIYDKYLYTADKNIMSVFDLSGAKPLLTSNEIYLQRAVETLFSYKDKLFMGTPTGMLIYSLEDPTQPRFRSAIGHVLACDPVVVEDDKAYVTIHTELSSSFMRPNANQLMVIDIKDIDAPRLIVSYSMLCPKGLGIDNQTLFVCDDGLKVFNAKDPNAILANQLVHFAGMDGYDVIPYKNTLMMIAEDGIYQYDYSNLQAITQLSKLPIGK